MWLQLLLCFLVGLTHASPAWKQNTEYTYEVHGRSLSSLHEASDYHTGIVLRASLVVQPQRNNRLRLKILQPEYAEVQINLPEGWMSELPQEHVSYQSLQLTNKPFDVVVDNGVIRELIVEEDVPEWEANIIKSLVSQLQLDTSAEHRVESELNVYPKEGSNNAVFKSLEDTVTGIAETTYDIHPLPEYILQSEPHLAPFPHLKGDGSIIEIVKNKNFTEGYDLPSYYFGFGNAGLWKPQSNHFAQISQRNSLGRAVVTGTLQRYTIQYSESSNRIILSFSKDGQPKGSVNSIMRIKLVNADQQTNQLPELSSSVSLGSLVYGYGKQESGSYKVSQGKPFQHEQYQKNEDNSKESIEEYSNHLTKRHPRSLRYQYKSSQEESSKDSIESGEDWTKPKSKLNEAHWPSLLPLTIGYNGMPIKNAPNLQIVEKIYSHIQQIGKELETPQEIPQEHTLSKYVLLTSLLRILNEQELKQLAERLYSQDTETSKYYAWVVFRDSLAEAGTGPAFMVIRDLIESKKLHGDKASNVILTMGQAVRQPSEEYIKSFYEMVKKQISAQQEDPSLLNETMLFTFTDLVHKVYVNRRFSHRQYPTHSFGKFNTEAGTTFVKNDVIPYLTKQLREAITDADSQKILAYIHALGNVGHSDIVYIFEPYLEGKIQISQFQRFMMVLALHNVAEVYPERLQPVFYRIYQNVGETTETRIIALYMLMHTNPSAEMLQRIAAYTNWEANHAVCAAVKSVIESASNLEGHQFAELSSAAESAKTLLTKRNFGIQDSMNILVSYASHNWESYYKHVTQTIVSEESGVPTSFYYALEGDYNGLKYRSLRLEALVSDIRNLFHVFYHQTEWFQEQQSKQQNSQQSEKSSWSSHKIARLLNLKTDELEQLEGRLFFQIGEWKKHLIFNNHSLEGLSQLVEKFETEFENGKKIKYTKLFNNHESAIAFPTEIGLPFLYTYDFPVLMHLEGNFKGKAQPKIGSGNKLVAPDDFQIEGEFKLVFSGKKHQQFGLVTPFSHQQYVAGYDQNIQVYMPLKAMVKLDLKNKDLQFEVEPLENENEVNLIHKSSWPYVSKRDILELETFASGKHTHIIRKRIQHQLDQVYGTETVGMSFRVRYENDGKYSAIESLMRGEVFDSPVQYEELNVEFMPEKSQNKELKVSFNFEKQEHQEEGTEYFRNVVWERMVNLPKDDKQRVSELLKQAAVGIPNARVYVADSKVQFSGKQEVKYVASIALSESFLRSKSRVLAYIKKESQIPESEPFEGALSANIIMARINVLDLAYIMDSDLKSFIEVDAAVGQKLPSQNRIEINSQFHRSEIRKQYLMEQPNYNKCIHEMQKGNKHLLACANMSQLAGLLDQAKVNFKYTLMNSGFLYNILEKYNSLLPYYDFKIEKNIDPSYQQNEAVFDIRFQPDLQRVNISVVNKQVYASIKNLYIDQWAKRVFVVHPYFNVIDRLQGKLTGYETYKPICSMDKTEAYTFDGAQYPLNLNNYWTVVLQYVPQRSAEHARSSVAEQLKHELENYVVLARQSSQNADTREFKIVVSTPRTDGQVLEVELKPTNEESYPQVFVDGKQIPVTDEDKAYESQYQGQIAVAGLPSGEVIVEVRDAFYVVYDGTRAKISPLTLKLRNAIRGLCGVFDGRENDDLITPNNCIVREPKEFIDSYTLLQNEQQNQAVTNLKSRAQNSHCVHQKVPLYVNYISEKTDRAHAQQSSSCSKYQTRYLVENGQICFSIKPLSACKIGCNQHGTVSKNVEVHCVENKNVASLWKSQIDKGASPDFSQKPVTKTVQMEVPQSCRSM